MYTCGLDGVFQQQHDADILMQWGLECIGLWKSQVLLMYCLKIVRGGQTYHQDCNYTFHTFSIKGLSTVSEK